MPERKPQNRVGKIKRRFGKNCFSEWGKRGGSPILRDWKAGRLKRGKHG